MRHVAIAVGTLVAIAIAVACGPSPVGVDTCRKIEAARCVWGPACGFDLSRPTRRSDSTSPVDDCIRYYDDACLHGLVAASDPGPTAADACVRAINAGDCAIVRNPETASACAFLASAPADSGADASAADADASSD